jgi:hypothetical protein
LPSFKRVREDKVAFPHDKLAHMQYHSNTYPMPTHYHKPGECDAMTGSGGERTGENAGAT